MNNRLGLPESSPLRWGRSTALHSHAQKTWWCWFLYFDLFSSSSSLDGPLGPRGLVEATEMCTQECLVLGHSDNCWMPPTLGTYQQPKSPVSSFGSQREWGPKDKLLNGHTLTRAWKNESGRSEHFGDRKQFGSGEGHFTSSGMADIPLVSLKSCQPASCPDSPKDQQL